MGGGPFVLALRQDGDSVSLGLLSDHLLVVPGTDLESCATSVAGEGHSGAKGGGNT